MGMDRMNSGFDRMSANMDMSRGFGQYGGGGVLGHMGGMSDRSKGGCQIFVRNVRMAISKGVCVCLFVFNYCVFVSAALL